MRLRLKILLAGATLLVGCTTMTATVGTECAAFKPISWSTKDTPETIAEVKAHNARRKAWCEGKR